MFLDEFASIFRKPNYIDKKERSVETTERPVLSLIKRRRTVCIT